MSSLRHHYMGMCPLTLYHFRVFRLILEYACSRLGLFTGKQTDHTKDSTLGYSINFHPPEVYSHTISQVLKLYGEQICQRSHVNFQGHHSFMAGTSSALYRKISFIFQPLNVLPDKVGIKST